MAYGWCQCPECGREFRSQRACNQHRDVKNHWPHECRCCYDTFETKGERREHEHEVHLYCNLCERTFATSNGLKMHLNSRVHRGQSISCPFCSRAFTSATGVSHHLELGACEQARGLNRETIYKFVRSKDPQGILSKNLLEWKGRVEYEANEYSWNDYAEAYECYLCHRHFPRLASLNQHLNSATHQQALYHCPNRQCRMDFKSLASIINHLESEACGFTRFESVQSKIGDLVSGRRRIAF